jgi:hypothetical protein
MYPSEATLVMHCSVGHPLRVSPNPLGVDIKNGMSSFKATNKERGPYLQDGHAQVVGRREAVRRPLTTAPSSAELPGHDVRGSVIAAPTA